MTKERVRLGESIQLVATSDEAIAYENLKSAAAPPMIWILGAPESEYERRHRQCRELQDKLWERVLPRLVSGEWEATGLTRGSPDRHRIPSEIWTELRCDFSKDEASSAPDLALEFYRVAVDLKRKIGTRVEPHKSRRRLSG